ncbi:hypothetical protein MNEG_1747 [Monoraphidium neglectum]|uniref:Ricin B lectin domain-containing protein n=1 Tax=Monoraphidium neglectum TaxID=145388 RepID=A0A0D2NP73_9CHLO|nr:hypothetical protein MNEG_1747 [Monoraphidium neglectum]KIZ06216.1 hypothetical protein MNEG_1747 [Monoraphidium neglectum]|eukprot:XP_013905235.1 hypothetical protein MNEG_1747 [Monoraphidium neglectum]
MLSHAITGLTFATAAPGAEPSCPPPPPGGAQQLLGANLKQGSTAAAARVHACVATSPTGPFVSSIQVTAPGGRCPEASSQVPFNLNGPIPGAPAVYACLVMTSSQPAALRALRVAFANPGSTAGAAACGPGFTVQGGDANAGAGAGGLAAYFCGTSSDQGLISKSLDPTTSGGDATLLVHPLSEGLYSCLTIAGGATLASSWRTGLRVEPWPCKGGPGGAPPGVQQQWVFVNKGGGKLQIQQAASRQCLSSLNGEGSLVYAYDCKTAAQDTTSPLPWQLWTLEPVAPRASAAVVSGGGGTYRIRAAAGGWCMQVQDEPTDYYDEEGDADMAWPSSIVLAQCSTSDPKQQFALESPGAKRVGQSAPAPAPAPAPGKPSIPQLPQLPPARTQDPPAQQQQPSVPPASDPPRRPPREPRPPRPAPAPRQAPAGGGGQQGQEARPVSPFRQMLTNAVRQAVTTVGGNFVRNLFGGLLG